MARIPQKDKIILPTPKPAYSGRLRDFSDVFPKSQGNQLDPSVNADPLNGGILNSGINNLLGSSDDTAQGVGASLSALDSGRSFADSLAAYIDQNNWITSEEQAAFFQALIQYLNTVDQRRYDQQLTEDQRRYNRELQIDQRIYDSPTNQLARLMGSGISRDAAIQLLSGAAGGSGVGAAGGSGMITQAAPTNPLPSPSGGVLLQGISVLNQLVQSGVDIAMAIPQIQAMQAQSFMSKQDLRAYESATNVTQMIQNLQQQGILSQKDFDSWSNLDDFQKWINDHAETNAVKPYFNNGSINGAFGSPFGRNYLNSFWDNVVKGRTSGDLAGEFLRSQRLQNTISSLQPDKIGAEMALIGVQTEQGQQEISESIQRIIESCNRVAVGDAQIEVLNAQGKWYGVQSRSTERLTDSQVDLMDSQRYGQDIENNEASLRYDYNSAGFPMLKQSRLYELQDELDKWSLLRSSQVRNERIATWLQEADNAYDAAYLKHISLEASGDFARYYPNLFMLSQGFKDVGVNDMVRSGSSVAGSVAALKKVKVF